MDESCPAPPYVGDAARVTDLLQAIHGHHHPLVRTWQARHHAILAVQRRVRAFQRLLERENDLLVRMYVTTLLYTLTETERFGPEPFKKSFKAYRANVHAVSRIKAFLGQQTRRLDPLSPGTTTEFPRIRPPKGAPLGMLEHGIFRCLVAPDENAAAACLDAFAADLQRALAAVPEDQQTSYTVAPTAPPRLTPRGFASTCGALAEAAAPDAGETEQGRATKARTELQAATMQSVATGLFPHFCAVRFHFARRVAEGLRAVHAARAAFRP